MASEKEMFLKTWETEYQTTLKVLKAYPQERQEYKPNEKSKSAKELAWVFAAEEQAVIPGVIAGNIDWASMAKTPETMKEALHEYEKIHKEMVKLFEDTPEETFKQTMKFFVAPKKMGDVPRMQVLWMILMDQVHHRGQFSVYLRLVGAKVPSIYGPTADEPWD
ncbi:hypothetical protein C4573_07310 [Candidatus Woesearchaeota archaeon]|nr:MAG: hypothetical protein C4573_07310 [Candidatus Woesearchaeota archaeon]